MFTLPEQDADWQKKAGMSKQFNLDRSGWKAGCLMIRGGRKYGRYDSVIKYRMDNGICIFGILYAGWICNG